MEVSKRKLKLKMNMFVKRQNQAQIMSNSSCDASSNPPCSCACWEMTQQLNEKVRCLALQMEKYGRLIREFEEIRGELLWEARGSPVEDADDIARRIKKEELEYSLEGLGDNLSVTEVDDDEDNEDSQCGNDEDSMDCVIVESVSLASTPDWPSSGESIPGFSGNSRSSGISVTAAKDHGHGHNGMDNNWGSFEEHLAVSENSMNGMSEQGEQQVEQTVTKRKRRKRGTGGGGGNASTPTGSLPEDDSLVCPHCATGHVFKEKASLRRHIQHFHAEERKTYDCIECNRTFQYKEGLAYHMRSVHEGIRHLCGVGGCTSAYSTITALRKHQRVVGHTGDGVMIRINEPGTYAMYKPEWENN